MSSRQSRATSKASSSSKHQSHQQSAVGVGPAPAFKSKVEEAIIKSNEPIQINEFKEITANNEKGIFVNRCEVCTWKGDLPINEYPINQDCNPDVITKKSCKKIEYNQQIAVRYLKPPAPAAAGEIIIRQEPNKPTAPAPPVIIRQQPPRPCTPEPLVIREAPPQAPPCISQKIITISGKTLPAPPRKVVVERLPPLPPKPQPVIVERWMPYTEQKRRVIYQQAPPDPIVCKPKNIIVQWETPDVCVKKDIKHLGVVCANPCDYVQKYGSSLKKPCELPQFVKDIKPQCGVELAANKKYDPCPVYELCGDVCALNKVNLDKEGLGAYKSQVREKCGIGSIGNCPQSHSSPAPSSSTKMCSAAAIQPLASDTSIQSRTRTPRTSNISNGSKHYGSTTTSGSAGDQLVMAGQSNLNTNQATSSHYASGYVGSSINTYAANYRSNNALCSGAAGPVQERNNTSFGGSTLYGSSALGSFSMSEGGSYTPLSFNY